MNLNEFEFAFFGFVFLILIEIVLFIFLAHHALMRPAFFMESAFPDTPPTKKMLLSDDRTISDRLVIYYGLRCFGWGAIALAIVITYRTISNN